MFRHATQAVFGRGPVRASLMLVGEVPGDKEDNEGEPFVGPAGHLLDEALESAKLTRDDVYLTNAVKHFKWQLRGTRRLHAKPSSREISACRPWLEAEIQTVRPHTIVCLGATAAQTLLGRAFRLTQHRGELLETPWATWILATYHPAAVLRAPDADNRREMRDGLVHDLQLAAASLRRSRNAVANRSTPSD